MLRAPAFGLVTSLNTSISRPVPYHAFHGKIRPDERPDPKTQTKKQSTDQKERRFFVFVFSFDPKASLSRALKVTPLKRGLNCNNSYYQWEHGHCLISAAGIFVSFANISLHIGTNPVEINLTWFKQRSTNSVCIKLFHCFKVDNSLPVLNAWLFSSPILGFQISRPLSYLFLESLIGNYGVNVGLDVFRMQHSRFREARWPNGWCARPLSERSWVEGSRNTPSRFMLQTPEISSGSYDPVGSKASIFFIQDSRFCLSTFLPNVLIIYKYFNGWRGETTRLIIEATSYVTRRLFK